MLPRKSLWTILLLTSLLFLTACGGGNAEVGSVPTLMELAPPTETFTLTPSLVPSATRTRTSTPTPTNTTTATATSTPTATLTFTPSITSTASQTPTSTMTATFTPTDTPPASATSTAPQITSYTANPTTSVPGGQVTLTWTSDSDGGRIEQLNAQGILVTVIGTVTPNGSLPVTIPTGQGTLINYRLVVQRGGQEVSQTVPITVTCSIPWFFGTIPNLPPSGCPTALGAVGAGAYQDFERGHMIYINANSANRVYGFQDQSNLYISYANGWDGATVHCTTIGAPPGGLFMPQGIFDWTYCTTLAPIGPWQSAVGWAMTNIDGNQRSMQTSDTGVIFMDDSFGGVYRLVPQSSGASNGSWTKVR